MNSAVLSELQELKRKDMDMRQKLLEAGNLYDDYDNEMQKIHLENAKRLNEIVDEFGWPGISLVGLEGSRVAWLIAQHSICTPSLQRKFVKEIESAFNNGDVPKKQVVLLKDKVLFHEGRPQKCGWVFDWQPDGQLGCEVESIEEANKLRRELDMPSFESAVDSHRESVKKEGGKMPGTYAEYKASADEWRKAIGWSE